MEIKLAFRGRLSLGWPKREFQTEFFLRGTVQVKTGKTTVKMGENRMTILTREYLCWGIKEIRQNREMKSV